LGITHCLILTFAISMTLTGLSRSRFEPNAYCRISHWLQCISSYFQTEIKVRWIYTQMQWHPSTDVAPSLSFKIAERPFEQSMSW